jgi:hypothetical protein
MPKSCPYCGKSDVKFSREHIVSRAVLKEAFGNPIKSISSGELLGGKTLIDVEPTTKSICRECNSALSPYDADAAEFAREILVHPSLIGVPIRLTQLRLNWLIKTHLNYLSITKSRLTRAHYPVSPDIYKSILRRVLIPRDLFGFGVETIEAREDNWDLDGDERLTYFRYTSVEFRSQRTVVSDLRLKSLWSYLVLPAGDYWLFRGRLKNTVEEMKQIRIDPQWIEVATVLGRVAFTRTRKRAQLPRAGKTTISSARRSLKSSAKTATRHCLRLQTPPRRSKRARRLKP